MPQETQFQWTLSCNKSKVACEPLSLKTTKTSIIMIISRTIKRMKSVKYIEDRKSRVSSVVKDVYRASAKRSRMWEASLPVFFIMFELVYKKKIY